MPSDREIVQRRPADLKPHPKNSRTHSDEQIDQIVRLVEEFGWTNPLLLDEEGTILAGHGRVKAALKRGDETVPTITLRGLSDDQKRALVIADNQVALNAGWDDAILRGELQALTAADFDLSMLGFSVGELNAFDKANFAPKADPDEVPIIKGPPVSTLGDVWILGGHRILCGNSTSKKDVQKAMNGRRAALCLTDPPYGLGGTTSSKNDYVEYEDTRANLVELIGGFFPLAQAVADVIVLTPGNANTSLYPAPTWTMAWFTPAGVGSGPWGFCCWQPMLCFGKDPKLAKGQGRHPDAIVHTESAEDFGHPCAKPIKFWSWLMERTSDTSDLIFDPFGGAGTTIIAAEMTDRQCYAIELSPLYVDVAVLRWQGVSGQQARRESDGALFDEVEPAELETA